MNYLILGSGGVGSYYGVSLLRSKQKVTFVARGKHLKAMKKKGLKLNHDDFSFDDFVDVKSLEEISDNDLSKFDSILLLTKAISTKQIAKYLSKKLIIKNMPYIVSLQNGVENEQILCEYFPKDKIIGGLSRKIGAFILEYGVVKSTGKVETIVGAIKKTKTNDLFIKKLCSELNSSNLHCQQSDNIKLELWKKLIINNGVNAICALLEIKTGVLMSDKKLSILVYNLMRETAIAAREKDVKVSKKDIKKMFELIKNFNSIKPSMLVDREQGRELELKEICGIVIKSCKKQGIDAPYTKTIAYLLEFMCKK